MQKVRKHILSTRDVPAALVQEAASSSIDIDIHSFIEVEAINDPRIDEMIERYSFQSITAIFTSMNAVDAVVDRLSNFKPNWKIGCIGYTTLQLATHYFGADNIIALGKDAEELAYDLLAKDDGPYVFFCGDIRRDDLPDIIKQEGKLLEELIVYKTIQKPAMLNKTYDGIAFFSPSAVESFFSVNDIPDRTILFAIGKTTAETIHKYTANTVVIADKPGKEEMLKAIIQYFN